MAVKCFVGWGEVRTPTDIAGKCWGSQKAFTPSYTLGIPADILIQEPDIAKEVEAGMLG